MVEIAAQPTSKLIPARFWDLPLVRSYAEQTATGLWHVEVRRDTSGIHYAARRMIQGPAQRIT